MKIQSVGNKIIARIEAVTGVILVTLGILILSNKWVDNLFLSVISFLKGRPPAPQWPGNLHKIGEVTLIIGAVVIGLFILPYWDRLKQSKFILQLAQKWDRLKQNKFLWIMASIAAIVFIAIIITLNGFAFSFIGNETDILPSMKQFVDHAWLPNDWYLNLNISYRQLFDFIFGQLLSRLNFEYAAYFGRLIVYLLLAIAIYVFFRTLHLRPWIGLLVLLFFLNHQSLAAGEWIVGGFDTKTVAYAMVILSSSFFIRKRYFTGFAFAGAALSFHVLVGIYALFCIAAASLLNQTWRSEWRLYIKNFWPFLITGFFGLRAVVEQILPLRGIDLNEAWNIYVYYRVPRHVMPFTWTNPNWRVDLALATVFFLIMFFMSKSKATRFIATFALGSVFLFLIGLGLYALGETELLRFYWFRFPDVMIPFLSAVLVALILNSLADGRFIGNSLFQGFQHGLQKLLRLLPPITLGFIVVMMIQQTQRLQMSYQDSLHNEAGTILPALEWISKNTPRQAIFLVDPTESDFYIYAQRAMLVSRKNGPQSAAAILEWYKRIDLCNGNADLAEGDSTTSAQILHENFFKLDEAQIQQISQQYGLNYYVGLINQKFSFERVYTDPVYAIYRIK